MIVAYRGCLGCLFYVVILRCVLNIFRRLTLRSFVGYYESMARKKKMGAPTLYKPSYCKKIIDYFNREPYMQRELSGSRGSVKVVNVANRFPTFERFAADIGIAVSTLYVWAEKHPDFKEAIKMCRQFQHDMLVTNGLAGAYNTAFAIFASKNLLRHENGALWSDRVENDHKSSDGSMSSISKNGEDALNRYLKTRFGKTADELEKTAGKDDDSSAIDKAE